MPGRTGVRPLTEDGSGAAIARGGRALRRGAKGGSPGGRIAEGVWTGLDELKPMSADYGRQALRLPLSAGIARFVCRLWQTWGSERQWRTKSHPMQPTSGGRCVA